ncbi:MAG: fibronectin type III domain-containing protein [Candidatus Firestonebacteria bacterium]|nr:fibronectin type III domain-containing protein [Candidatus Firestonebacteria bacterium]
MKKLILVVLFYLLVSVCYPRVLICQQERFTWSEIIKLIRKPDVSYEKKIETIKNNGFNCDSTFPDDYPLKLIQIEKNKLLIDSIIEEINRCKKTLTIITKPAFALLYIDREKKGESDKSGIFDITVKPGRYSIKVSKEGYYDSMRTVISGGQEKTEIFELRTRLYTITFDINPQDAEIYMLKENNSFKNKKLSIKDNILNNLKLGEYIFKIKKEGYLSKEQHIYLNKDEIFKIKLDKKIIPFAPENLMSDISQNELTITWDKAPNATKYTVYYSESENVKESHDFVVTEATSFTIKGLPPGTKYFFGVTGLNEEGEESDLSQVIRVVVSPPVKQRPAAPSYVKIISGVNFAFIEWDKVEDVSYYNLYYKEGDFDTTEYSRKSWQKVDRIHTLNRTVDNLKSGEKYSFAVTGVNYVGESDFSKTVTTIIPEKQDTPLQESYIPQKSFLSLEYQDIIRITNSKSLKDGININYVAKFIKWNYEFKKRYSIFLRTGSIKVGLPDEYGNESFAYGGGLKINVLSKDIINLDVRLDLLDLKNERDSSQQQFRRKINWTEYRTGLTGIFYNNSIYSPYIGINYIKINGKLNYDFSDVKKNVSYDFKEDKESEIEYFLGIKINRKNYFMDSEMYLFKDLDNFSFKIGLGRYF